MISAGIDLGAKTTKVVILADNKIVSQCLELTGIDQAQTAEKALSNALEKANLSRDAVNFIVATGVGRNAVSFANKEISDVAADARGIIYLLPDARTVIDIGAEEGRAIKCFADGRVQDFAINEKCAAGAGTFVETMARALEVDVEEFGKMSLRSTNTIAMNAQCTVFAESEVVSLVHAKTAKEDISKAIHDAIASRIISMVRRVGVEEKIAVIGGVAKNPGFIDSLKRGLEINEILIPDEPEFTGALGAALTKA
ncbi:MAG: CoA activase [Candidatus Fischerbacteria bacterium RBG_13_37_8]|uniref:CoA activase n=1 Tax=Candidatus Fischerbacteria bacterium RBG_13_37_8 TaxID=1817863 RepID=A0A1F5V5U4_9BACT|nr:MAG: CoA activase [Candidatus Fischerbacteria bacterium RBG_13_37_8]